MTFFFYFSVDIYDQKYIKTYYTNEKEAEIQKHKKKEKKKILLYHIIEATYFKTWVNISLDLCRKKWTEIIKVIKTCWWGKAILEVLVPASVKKKS